MEYVIPISVSNVLAVQGMQHLGKEIACQSKVRWDQNPAATAKVSKSLNKLFNCTSILRRILENFDSTYV